MGQDPLLWGLGERPRVAPGPEWETPALYRPDNFSPLAAKIRWRIPGYQSHNGPTPVEVTNMDALLDAIRKLPPSVTTIGCALVIMSYVVAYEAGKAQMRAGTAATVNAANQRIENLTLSLKTALDARALKTRATGPDDFMLLPLNVGSDIENMLVLIPTQELCKKTRPLPRQQQADCVLPLALETPYVAYTLNKSDADETQPVHALIAADMRR